MFAGAAVVVVVVGSAQVVELDARLGAETHRRARAVRVAVRVLKPGTVGVGVVSAATTTTTPTAAVVVVGRAAEEHGGLHHLQRQPDDVGCLGARGLDVGVRHHAIVGGEILVVVAMGVVKVAHDGDFAGLATAVLALLAPLPRNAGALEREDGEAIGAVGVVASLVVGRGGGSIQQLLGRVGEARGQGRASAGGRVRGAAGRGRRGRGRGRRRGRLREVVERVEQPRRGGAELGVGGGRWTGGARWSGRGGGSSGARRVGRSGGLGAGGEISEQSVSSQRAGQRRDERRLDRRNVADRTRQTGRAGARGGNCAEGCGLFGLGESINSGEYRGREHVRMYGCMGEDRIQSRREEERKDSIRRETPACLPACLHCAK